MGREDFDRWDVGASRRSLSVYSRRAVRGTRRTDRKYQNLPTPLARGPPLCSASRRGGVTEAGRRRLVVGLMDHNPSRRSGLLVDRSQLAITPVRTRKAP
jgi:hypothetical protein